MSEPNSPVTGAGPLYPQTPAGLAAAEEPVRIPYSGDDDDADEVEADRPDAVEHPTGEEQAAENRENEPPA